MFNYKNIYKHLLMAASLLALLPACQKDSVEFEPYTNGQKELSYLLEFVPQEQTTTTFILQGAGLTTDTMLTTSNGVRVSLQNNDFLFALENGTPQPCSACATVKVEVTEVLRTGDWISRRLTSVGENGLLVSHVGAVHVKVHCDAKQLQLAPDRYLKVYIPESDNQGSFHIAYGEKNTEGDFQFWAKGSENSVFSATWPAINTPLTYKGLELLARKLGWVTATTPTVSLNDTRAYCINLPQQFDQDNTRVFAVFEDGKILAEMLPEPNTGVFCLDNAPMDKPVRIISVSKAGPQYWLGDLTTLTASDANARLVPLESSDQQILAFLQGL